MSAIINSATRIFSKANLEDVNAAAAVYMNHSKIRQLPFETREDVINLFKSRIIENGISGLYVIKEGGKIVGTASLDQYRWQCCHGVGMSDFIVEDDNKEIGIELLKAIEGVALKSGIKRIEFDVNENENSVLEIFKAAGYVEEVLKKNSIMRPAGDSPENARGLGRVIGLDSSILKESYKFDPKIIKPSSKSSQPYSVDHSLNNLGMHKAKEHEFAVTNEIYTEPHAFRYLYGNIAADFVGLFAERVSKNLKEGISGLYLLKDGDKAVATVNLTRLSGVNAHVLFIGGLAVHKNYQGRGIGLTLLAKIEEIAVKAGIKRMELDVESDNPGAINLYIKAGFENEGIKPIFVKRRYEKHYVDELFMGKVLK